jgi:HEPN domain-containing protein
MLVKKRHPPDTPLEWINRAESDLSIAKSHIEGAYLEDLCYHSQQCVEKALKAVLLHHCGKFPYIHDLSELINQIKQAGIEVPQVLMESVVLTEFAVEGRYPGFDQPVTPEQWRDAVRKAENVLEWAKKVIKDK